MWQAYAIPAHDPDPDAPEPAPASAAPGPGPFSVGVRDEGGTTIVSPVGEVDIATVPTLCDALRATPGPLVLDLAAVTFLDTTGLRLVVEQERLSGAAGHPFSIVPGPPDVQRIFDIAGLRERLPFVGPRAPAAGDSPPGA